MNYTLVLVGNGSTIPDTTLGIFFRPEGQRPLVGEQLEYKGRVYRVQRASPATNPTTSTVTYYIEPYNSNAPYRTKR